MTPEINQQALERRSLGLLWSRSSTKKVAFMLVIVDHDNVSSIYMFIPSLHLERDVSYSTKNL
jgi:hypothetical protein